MNFHRPTDLASLELPVANRLVMAVLARLASRPEGVVETGGFAPVEPVPPERLREWLMAKANVLNASTSTFLELIGHGRTYRVPAYQRDYSWTEEQWEELWTDLTGLADRPEETHYMGALVV